MALTTTPAFTINCHVARTRITAANTARDGSGTLNNLKQEDNSTDFSGATNGTLIKRITFISAQATAAVSSANVGRLFVSDNTGSNFRLLDEVIIATQTPSTTVLGAMGLVDYMRRQGGLKIGSGVKIAATISVYAGVQDQMDVLMEYEDF